MYEDEDLKAIASVLIGKVWNKYFEEYLNNRKETLIRNISNPTDREYTAGRLGELLEFRAWVDQRLEDYKNIK